MSKFTLVETEICNVAALQDALKEMGYPFEVHEEAQPLKGYEGNFREEKANIIIRRKDLWGGANDIGFLKDKDGKYTMIISVFDRSTAKGKEFMKQCPFKYGEKVAERAIRKVHGTVMYKKEVDGKIKIRLRAP